MKNDFSWSVSRDKQFEACKLQYYYARYGSWGGWEHDAPDKIKRLYMLKQLSNRWAWRGKLVHEGVEYTLKEYKAGRIQADVDFKSASDLVKQMWERTHLIMKNQFKASMAGRYRDAPKKITGLKEHENGEDVPNDKWTTIMDEVKTSIYNLANMPAFQTILGAPGNIVTIEEMKQSTVLGHKTFYIIDVLMKDKNGDYTVIDWKTSNSMTEMNEVQLGYYAYVLEKDYGVPTTKIKLVECNPAVKKEKVYRVTSDDMEKTKIFLEDSVAKMAEYVTLKDLKMNEAKPEGDFRPDGIDKQGSCIWCNFTSVCDAFKASGRRR